MRRDLLRREPAVDDELRAHHAAGVVAGEEDDAVGHFVRGDQAADGLFNLDLIEQLLPLLEDGDILIDGGNSHFPDRRWACRSRRGKHS